MEIEGYEEQEESREVEDRDIIEDPDIYTNQGMEESLEDEGISAEEQGFMQGFVFGI